MDIFVLADGTGIGRKRKASSDISQDNSSKRARQDTAEVIES